MAKDAFHELVRQALMDEGWFITHDPFILKFKNKKVEIDLAAEKLIAAEKGEDKIAIEVKSFLTASVIYEFHAALGQFINYRRILRLKNLQRTLFLALLTDIFDAFLDDEFGWNTIKEEKLNLHFV